MADSPTPNEPFPNASVTRPVHPWVNGDGTGVLGWAWGDEGGHAVSVAATGPTAGLEQGELQVYALPGPLVVGGLFLSASAETRLGALTAIHLRFAASALPSVPGQGLQWAPFIQALEAAFPIALSARDHLWFEGKHGRTRVRVDLLDGLISIDDLEA